ncbi:hypothetical protein CEE44_04355 [Candidatus Woesearchaeota archaeon B3_Woes]|nr:MAG: hypothetical protein CEE44_04355 [Candidatus Woesearchaeota archaeon B3_Woes]
MRRNKKGGLNLSINAIVVLILAITMLGLGLSFMRNIFGSATKEFEEVGGTVKKQMIDQMKESDKVFDLSRPKVELKAGEDTQIFIGFKNKATVGKNFQLRQVEASRLGETGSTNRTNVFNVTTAGVISMEGTTTGLCGARTDSGTEPTDVVEVYLEFKGTKTKVAKGSVVVVPINIKTTSSSNVGSCVFELKGDSDADSVGTPDYNKIVELTVDVVS